MGKLTRPPKESIIYEDQKLYICLAKYPITKGHTVVVFKKDVADLKLLPDRDYDYLMDTVFAVKKYFIKNLKD